jgi:hypothetical protein
METRQAAEGGCKAAGLSATAAASPVMPRPVRAEIGCERARRALVNAWVQRAILVAVIACVFWDGIWAGVPRSDHVVYLHHISQFDNLWDILSHSPAWNRTATDLGGDVVLYRPVLYLLLGTFYYLFRYHFVAWQIASLCLHIVVVLGLHLLLLLGRLKQTLFPLAIGLLFATAFFASELVLWNHLVGYLLFCALDVYAVYFFLRFLQSNRTAFLLVCGALSLVAEFTYEMGALVNLLFAAALLARSLSAPAADGPLAPAHRGPDLRFALMFVVSALLLPIASLLDLRARGIVFSPHLHGMSGWTMAVMVGESMFRRIGLWMGAWVAPTMYQVLAGSRALGRLSVSGLTALKLLNLAALVWLVVIAVRALGRLRHNDASKRAPEFALALSMLFVLGYSMIIAIGRFQGQGQVAVVQANIYYGYVAYLAVCVGIAAAAAVDPARATAHGPTARHIGAGTGWPPADRSTRLTRGLVPALAILAIANACGVRVLAHAYRYDYAAPRQQVIDRVQAWHRQIGERSQRYFVVGPTCHGNEPFVDFGEAQLRRGSGWRPPVTLADALWPERSADLNAARIPIPVQSVDEIRCD